MDPRHTVQPIEVIAPILSAIIVQVSVTREDTTHTEVRNTVSSQDFPCYVDILIIYRSEGSEIRDKQEILIYTHRNSLRIA